MASARTPEVTERATGSRPGLRPNGGRLGLLATHAVVELRSTARSMQFVIGAVALPALLYAMFGLSNASPSNVLPDGTHVGTMQMVSFCAYGVVSLAIFTFGESVAEERGRGWVRTMRATPLPSWSFFAAKVGVALVGGLLIVASTGGLAVAAGNVRLDAGTWLAITLTMLAGVLAFSTLGFAIAYAVRPRAATAIANLIFLPLAFLSGFFVPLGELPSVLSDIAVWLPTYHFGQLAWQYVAPAADAEAWTSVAPASTVVHLAWVLGSVVVFGAIAALASRRAGITSRA
nr:ABC transporter permease [Egibacter rhizosphaerae]